MATPNPRVSTDGIAAPAPARRPSVETVGTAVLGVLRVAGAGLLATNAGIHAYLWQTGYRTIPVIGVLFLLDAVAAALMTLAVLGVSRRWLPVLAALGALLEVGTVGGLVLSTVHSLFGFVESTQVTFYWQSVTTETVGAVLLVVLAGVAHRLRRVRTSPRAGAKTFRW